MPGDPGAALPGALGVAGQATTWSPRVSSAPLNALPMVPLPPVRRTFMPCVYPIVANVPVSSVIRAIPASFASATTAAATAGATSRSKTLGMM